jgi:hypothetical protein
MIDLRDPLAQLAQRMPWAELGDALSMTLPPAPVAGGRPALPVRLMAGLLYLKHAHLSDEDTCRRWLENPYWQSFTGEVSSRPRCRAIPARWGAGVNAQRVLRRQRALLGRIIRDIGWRASAMLRAKRLRCGWSAPGGFTVSGRRTRARASGTPCTRRRWSASARARRASRTSSG